MTETVSLIDLQFLRPSYSSTYFENYNHGKIGCYGLNLENNKIHINIWHSLNSSSNSSSFPFSYILLDSEFDYKKTSKMKEDDVAKGILKKKWLNKHIDSRPITILIFYQVEWESKEWDEEVYKIQSMFISIREKIADHCIPLILVLVQDHPFMIIDAPTFKYNNKLSSLCSSCNITSKSCFTFPALSTQIYMYLARIEPIIMKLSVDYCNNIIIKYKEQRDENIKTGSSICKNIRLSLKSSIYFELKQDFYGALKNYMLVYNQLIDSSIKDFEASELKILAGYLSCKICRLCIDTGVPLDAIHHFTRFNRRFNTIPSTDSQCEHYLWLCHQHIWFAKVVESASSANLFSINPSRHAGVYYASAADYAIKTQNYIKHISIEPLHTQFQFKIQQSAYIGKYARILLSSSNEYNSESYNKLFNNLVNILNSNLDFSRLILSLLESSLAHYKIFKSSRMQISLLAKISYQNSLINIDNFHIDNEIVKLCSNVSSKWFPNIKISIERLIIYYFNSMMMGECFKCIITLFELYIYENSVFFSDVKQLSNELFLFLSSLVQGTVNELPSFFHPGNNKPLNIEVTIPFNTYRLNYSPFNFINFKTYFEKPTNSNINNIRIRAEIFNKLPINLSYRSIIVHLHYKEEEVIFNQSYCLDKYEAPLDEIGLLRCEIWNSFQTKPLTLPPIAKTELSIDSLEIILNLSQEFSLVIPIENYINYHIEYSPWNVINHTTLSVSSSTSSPPASSPPAPSLLDLKLESLAECIYNEHNSISLKLTNLSSNPITEIKSKLLFNSLEFYNETEDIEIRSNENEIFDSSNNTFIIPLIASSSSIIINFTIKSKFLGNHLLLIQTDCKFIDFNLNLISRSFDFQKNINIIFPFILDVKLVGSNYDLIMDFCYFIILQNRTKNKITLEHSKIITEPADVVQNYSYLQNKISFNFMDQIRLLNQIKVEHASSSMKYFLYIQYCRMDSGGGGGVGSSLMNELVIDLRLANNSNPSWILLSATMMNFSETEMQNIPKRAINLSIINVTENSLIINYKMISFVNYSNIPSADDKEASAIYIYPNKSVVLNIEPSINAEQIFESVVILKFSKNIELTDAKDYFDSEIIKQLKLVKS